MDINFVQEELMRRYLYLYENKELILALCINYGTREKYCKRKIKELNKMLHSNNRLSRVTQELLFDLLEKLKREMHEPKLYLYSKVSDEIVNAYEEFLFTDENIEKTVLYKHIEALKNNPLFLESVQNNIDGLEERRQNNTYLEKIQTFTVWKILTYVKNRNRDNRTVLDALEKYYNIDRYMLTGIDWESGYKLIPDDYENEEKLSCFPKTLIIAEAEMGGEYNAVVFNYPGNEFEEEDDYFAYDWSLEFNEEPIRKGSKSNFMTSLAIMPMLPEKLKSEMYKKVKYPYLSLELK